MRLLVLSPFLRSRGLIAGIAFLFTGCGLATDSPQNALEAFNSALDLNDIDKFRNAVSAETVSAVNVARDSGVVSGDILELLLERYRSCRPYRVTEVSIDGTNAELSVNWKDPTDGETKIGKFHFIKSNSEWRIDLKNDIAAWVEASKWIKEVDGKLQDSVPDGFFSGGH